MQILGATQGKSRRMNTELFSFFCLPSLLTSSTLSLRLRLTEKLWALFLTLYFSRPEWICHCRQKSDQNSSIRGTLELRVRRLALLNQLNIHKIGVLKQLCNFSILASTTRKHGRQCPRIFHLLTLTSCAEDPLCGKLSVRFLVGEHEHKHRL